MTSEVESAIDELHRCGRLRGAQLYAFGHTAATEQMRRRLGRYDIALTGILDNNRAKQGSSLHGVPVIPPRAVAEASAQSIVLIASRFHSEMHQQLVELGYPGEIIRLGTLSIGTDKGDGDDSERGAQLLEHLRDTHPDRHLVVCPFGALGDVYWALAYLPAFAAARRLPPAVVVVVGEGCLEVARLFGHEDMHSLAQDEMDDLVTAVVAAAPPGATIAHHDRPHGDNAPARALDHRFVTFADIYRDLVYKLPVGTRPQAPRPDLKGQADRRSWSHEIPRGRTVLMAPYAKSVVPVPWSFWEQTAGRHASQGDVVATLVHGDEDPVSGTPGLEIPLREMLDAVEHAGTFIGLRSGLCDVVHTARARKVHVFPDAYYSTTPYKVADFFALPGWESLVIQVS